MHNLEDGSEMQHNSASLWTDYRSCKRYSASLENNSPITKVYKCLISVCMQELYIWWCSRTKRLVYAERREKLIKPLPAGEHIIQFPQCLAAVLILNCLITALRTDLHSCWVWFKQYWDLH